MFTIQQVQNPQWTSAAEVSFQCDVKFAEFDAFLPVGVTATDPYPHIQELWAAAVAGTYGPIAEYVKQLDEYPAEIPVGGDPETPATQGVQTL